MNEIEKSALQQKISLLEKQQEEFLGQLIKLTELISRLAITINEKIKKEIIKCQQEKHSQKKIK
jgi:hypothetical protein